MEAKTGASEEAGVVVGRSGVEAAAEGGLEPASGRRAWGTGAD